MGDDPVAWGKIGLVEKAIKTLNESKECGFQSDCHCDEVDGVICQDNLCRWNLIEVDYEITS